MVKQGKTVLYKFWNAHILYARWHVGPNSPAISFHNAFAVFHTVIIHYHYSTNSGRITDNDGNGQEFLQPKTWLQNKMVLISLDWRKLKGVLIEACKIINSMDRVNSERLFPTAEKSNTREQKLKVRSRFSGHLRKRVLPRRCLEFLINCLRLVDAYILLKFKHYPDNHLNHQSIVMGQVLKMGLV